MANQEKIISRFTVSAILITGLAPIVYAQPSSMYPQIDAHMFSLIEKEEASNPTCENLLKILAVEKESNTGLKLEDIAPFKYTKGAVVGAYVNYNGDNVRMLKQYQTRVTESFQLIEALCKSGEYEYYAQVLKKALEDSDTKKMLELEEKILSRKKD